MPSNPGGDRLSGIPTMWTVLRAAHGGPPDAAGAAKQLILERYGPAVRRYLTGLLRDTHAADDLTQEFALLVVTGKFRTADPARGRFRHYVKATLFHLVAAHARKARSGPAVLPPDATPLAGHQAGPGGPDDDAAFRASWRAELLARTWAVLADAHTSYYQLLKLRADHPDDSSDELAARVAAATGRPTNGPAVRQGLKRARGLFAGLLRDEVAHSLDDPSAAAVDEELAELDLLRYVRDEG
jgi:RNA polymerase sigma-70 factor (ECF subfamily)